MWAKLSLHCEGLLRLEAAMARLERHPSGSDQARLWLWIGMLSSATPAKAVAALEQAVAVYRRLEEALGLGVSLARLGVELALMSRFDQSALVLAEALPLLERSGVVKALAQYFDYSGILKMLSGDPASAREQFEKALSLCRRAGAEREVLRIVGNIAELAWILGDLDSAAAGFYETVALVREMPLITKSTLGFNLLNLAGVLTERGELDEALAAARDGLPLLRDGGYVWFLLDHVALRAALAGKVTNAARVAGYVDSVFAAKESSRQPNEARARDRLQTLLREKLTSNELERLLAEGAKMTEDDACHTAVDE